MKGAVKALLTKEVNGGTFQQAMDELKTTPEWA